MSNPAVLPVSSLDAEVKDLEALLSGIPPELRQGGAFSAYELRLEILRQQSAAQSYRAITAKLVGVLRIMKLAAPLLASAVALSLLQTLLLQVGGERASVLIPVLAGLANLLVSGLLIYWAGRADRSLGELSRSQSSGSTDDEPRLKRPVIHR